AKAEACATEMAGPLAAAIPASALAAIATPILSFRSEQVMRIAASMDVFRCQPVGCSAGQPKFAAARRRVRQNGHDFPYGTLTSRFTPTSDILNPRGAAAQGFLAPCLHSDPDLVYRFQHFVPKWIESHQRRLASTPAFRRRLIELAHPQQYVPHCKT